MIVLIPLEISCMYEDPQWHATHGKRQSFSSHAKAINNMQLKVGCSPKKHAIFLRPKMTYTSLYQVKAMTSHSRIWKLTCSLIEITKSWSQVTCHLQLSPKMTCHLLLLIKTIDSLFTQSKWHQKKLFKEQHVVTTKFELIYLVSKKIEGSYERHLALSPLSNIIP